MKNPPHILIVPLVALVGWLACPFTGLQAADPLEERFLNPPADTRPWVYWFWMNGNISKEGITADLEALAENGYGGVLQMSTTMSIPKGRYEFNSPEWRELMVHAVEEAGRLGLEFTLHHNAGYCGAGGPYVTPDIAMQTLTSSELAVEGPQVFNDKLPVPDHRHDYYEDIAVYAIPLEGKRIDMQKAAMTPSDEVAGLEKLTDGDGDNFVRFRHPTPGNPVVFTFEFDEPQTVRSFVVGTPKGPNQIGGVLEYSDDGSTFYPLQRFAMPRLAAVGKSVRNIPETSARYFRFVFDQRDARAGAINRIAEMELSPIPRIDDFPKKAGYAFAGPVHIPDQLSEIPTVPIDEVIDITKHLDADGQLTWNVPSGDWVILRMGKTTTGMFTVAAPEGGYGLEIDKMNRKFVQQHLDQMFIEIDAAADGKALTSTHVDSWEVGTQNWTVGFAERFEELRGYDPMPYLPIAAGWQIGNQAIAERFLADWRKTIADLIATEFFGGLQDILEQRGQYLSAQGYGHGYFNNLQVSRMARRPMAEFWVRADDPYSNYPSVAASAANLQGEQIVGAEAFTSGDEFGKWQMHPSALKNLGDRYFARGINRFVFHRYAQQPWLDRYPGMSYGPFGINLDRTGTWFDKAKGYTDYLARTQSLLQAGVAVKDYLVFTGEHAPNTPSLPGYGTSHHYDYHYALEEDLEQLQVKDGKLVHPSGQTYSLLVLPDSTYLSVHLLETIQELVRQGANVLGSRPEGTPLLQEFLNTEIDFIGMVDQLWDYTDQGEQTVGSGRMLWGGDLDQAMQTIGLASDVKLPNSDAEEPLILWNHRATADADFYFLSNQSGMPIRQAITFRVTGLIPELWNPRTAERKTAPFWKATADGGTTVELAMAKDESIFVVFRQPHRGEPSLRSVTLDGEEAFAEAEAPEKPQVDIVTASYGIPGQPEKQVDVTEKIRELLAAGMDSFRAFPSDLGVHDPAPHEKKTLEITFSLNGQQITKQATDTQDVKIPKSTDEGIRILSAIYAVIDDPETHADVTAYVQQLVDDGVESVKVIPQQLGLTHPVAYKPKLLTIKYQQAGETKTLEGNDMEMLDLPQPTKTDGAPPLVPKVAISGRTLQLTTQQAGHYQISTHDGKVYETTVAAIPGARELEGWNLAFPAQFAYSTALPKERNLATLVPWNASDDANLKYFSGTGTYTTRFELAQEHLADDVECLLDLGSVGVLANVYLNDKRVGNVWMPPYRIDLTEHLVPGTNQLRVEVTNLWTNRLIGDAALPHPLQFKANGAPENWPEGLFNKPFDSSTRSTFTTWDFFKPNDPLTPSGLMGPARLLFTKKVVLPLN